MQRFFLRSVTPAGTGGSGWIWPDLPREGYIPRIRPKVRRFEGSAGSGRILFFLPLGPPSRQLPAPVGGSQPDPPGLYKKPVVQVVLEIHGAIQAVVYLHLVLLVAVSLFFPPVTLSPRPRCIWAFAPPTQSHKTTNKLFQFP